MAMVQNQWYYSGIGAPPMLDYFSGDWDVHWGTGFSPMAKGCPSPVETLLGDCLLFMVVGNGALGPLL